MQETEDLINAPEMQKCEGESRVKRTRSLWRSPIVLTVVFLLSVLAIHVGWALWNLNSFDKALQDGDVKAIERAIDWDSLRGSASNAVQDFVNEASPATNNLLGNMLMRALIPALMRELATPEGFAARFKNSDRPKIVSWQITGPTSYSVVLDDGTPVQTRLKFAVRDWRWKLIGIELIGR
jgi:Protein of unknown function (DUF2939)